MALNQDKKSAFKLAQLQTVSSKTHDKIIENILNKEGDINYAIPVNGSYRFSNPSFIGYTALHFAYARDNINLFICLLKNGADFTLKNRDGDTVLHMLIAKMKTVEKPLDNPFIEAVLSAHVNSKNFSNPCNKDGLSHFHVACMTRNSEAVQFYLENGVLVDESIDMDSKFSPGFTPLHFAAITANTEVAEILIESGANMNIPDASRMTALHVLIKDRIRMLDSIGDGTYKKVDNSYKKLQKQIIENEKIINMLMENMSTDSDCLDNIGLSTFHVACVLQDLSAAQHLIDRVTDLDHCVDKDSRLWPGYTALHFAAHISIDTVEMLIRKGANMEVEDAEGLTALDLCIERFKIEDICRIMSLNAKWEGIVLSDDQTKLLSFIRSLADLKLLKQTILSSIENMKMIIPKTSPLWPGYTPLHLAVLFAENSKQMFCDDREAKNDMDLQIIEFFSSNNADLSMKDGRGQTALHLAYRLKKIRTVETMIHRFLRIPNVCDDDDMSHLHIVCAVSKEQYAIKKCAFENSEVNLAYKGTSPVNGIIPGSTPLHACLANLPDKLEGKLIIEILLEAGADPHAEDAYGLTPVHWLMKCTRRSYKDTSQLFAKLSKDCVAEEYGLSYLHVACKLGNAAAVNNFIKKGANVNLAIKYKKRNDEDPLGFLAEFDLCTPLHHLMPSYMFQNLYVLERLVAKGADVFAERTNGSKPLDDWLILYCFVPKVWEDVDLQTRMENEFGWTRLHLACFLLKAGGFQDLIEAESTKVNAQVSLDSPRWNRCTPLHLLLCRLRDGSLVRDEQRDGGYVMVGMLLNSGADVTVVDDQQNTPVTMLFEDFECEHHLDLAALLMKHHRDFGVNPVNSQGLSHFHIACYLNDLEAVRGFISYDVDVNQPIDYFAEWCPGYTPLHLASQLQVVELLIDHGADVNIENVRGHTALAAALERDVFDENAVAKIIQSGADVNYLTFDGQTMFEIAISSGRMTMEKLIFFIEQEFHVNSCNPITGVGYIAIILRKHYEDKNLQMCVVERIMSEKSTTTFGRTTLHHTVTGPSSDISLFHYAVLFAKLIKSGVDIDEQDNEGKTALHLAVKFSNVKAVQGLLKSGADVNVVDMSGKPAISYISNQSASMGSVNESGQLKDILSLHLSRLMLLNLDLSQVNVNAVSNFRKHIHENHDFLIQVAATKDMTIGVRSMRLSDFLTETGAIVMYPSLSQLERNKLEEYFESIDLAEIQGILKLQYKKATKREELIYPAKNSFLFLLSFDLPDLCIHHIFQYLHNSDLKNIIKTEIEKENVKIDVN